MNTQPMPCSVTADTKHYECEQDKAVARQDRIDELAEEFKDLRELYDHMPQWRREAMLDVIFDNFGACQSGTANAQEAGIAVDEYFNTEREFIAEREITGEGL